MSFYNYGPHQGIKGNSHISTGVAKLASDTSILLDGLKNAAGFSIPTQPKARKRYLASQKAFIKMYGTKRFATKDEIKAAQYLRVDNNLVVNHKNCTVCVSGTWVNVQFVKGTPVWAMETIKRFLEKKKMFYSNKPYKWSRPFRVTSDMPYIAIGPRTDNFTGWAVNKYTRLGFINK